MSNQSQTQEKSQNQVQDQQQSQQSLFKVNAILKTLANYHVYEIAINPSAFESIEKCVRILHYSKEYRLQFKSQCMCDNTNITESEPNIYGSIPVVVINTNYKIYYQYLVCSRCANNSPERIWERLVSSKILFPYSSSLLDNEIKDKDFKSTMKYIRDRLIEIFNCKQNRYVFWSDSEKEAVEQEISRFYIDKINKKVYLEEEQITFLANLLTICSGTQTNMFDLEPFIYKYTALPISPLCNGYFAKVFITPAWRMSLNYGKDCNKDFCSLYPLISLWNTLREDVVRTIDYKRYEECEKFRKKWQEETGAYPEKNCLAN